MRGRGPLAGSYAAAVALVVCALVPFLTLTAAVLPLAPLLSKSLGLIAAVPPLVTGWPTAKMPWTAAIMNLCVFGAVALGPTIGGVQAVAGAWRPLFWAVAGIGGVALAFALLTFEDAPADDPSAPWDLVALALAGPGCAAAFYSAAHRLRRRRVGLPGAVHRRVLAALGADSAGLRPGGTAPRGHRVPGRADPALPGRGDRDERGGREQGRDLDLPGHRGRGRDRGDGRVRSRRRAAANARPGAVERRRARPGLTAAVRRFRGQQPGRDRAPLPAGGPLGPRSGNKAG